MRSIIHVATASWPLRINERLLYKNKFFAKNVKLSNIAKRTVGFSGADLENLLNEAALLAVRRDKKVITMAEIDEAHDRVLMGPAKKSHQYTEKEKKILECIHDKNIWIMFM